MLSQWFIIHHLFLRATFIHFSPCSIAVLDNQIVLFLLSAVEFSVADSAMFLFEVPRDDCDRPFVTGTIEHLKTMESVRMSWEQALLGIALIRWLVGSQHSWTIDHISSNGDSKKHAFGNTEIRRYRSKKRLGHYYDEERTDNLLQICKWCGCVSKPIIINASG